MNSYPERKVFMQAKWVFCILVSFHYASVTVCVAAPSPAFLINELKKHEENMDGISADFRAILVGVEPRVDFTGSFKYGSGNHWLIRRNWKNPDLAWSEVSHIGNDHVTKLLKPENALPIVSTYVAGDNFPPIQIEMEIPPLWGFIATSATEYVSIRELLKTMSLSVETDVDKDTQNELAVLKGRNTEAELSVWFLSKEHYSPVRILYKTAESESEMKDKTKTILYECLLSGFRIIEGIPCPHEVTVIRRSHFVMVAGTDGGGRQVLTMDDILRDMERQGALSKDFLEKRKKEPPLMSGETKKVTLSNVELRHKFSVADFAITTPIEDGTLVTAKNARHLPHVWQDDKPVPLYDPAILEARDLSFLGSPTSPRFWMNMLSFVLIFSALTWMAYKHFKKQKENN